ncbi:hypothetical protein SAZ11_48870 [Streptomyces sp. FXJ1.4098]|nr:hypothetical protein [Streptomyces sp. FXJ1.4098]
MNAYEACSATLTRYLALCDVPAGAEGELGDLFTEDAVWEGAAAPTPRSSAAPRAARRSSRC